MDSSGLGAGFLSGPDGGLLDLESPLHRHQQTHLAHPSLTQQHHLNMMNSNNINLGSDHHSPGLMEMKGSNPKGLLSMNLNRGKAMLASLNATTHHYNTSEEEEEQKFAEDENGGESNEGGQKDKKGSPWQRMKWTDNIVKLLIQVVAYVGDDGEGSTEGLKRKSGILQKKGKWKTISKIMISKGCHVSPQQCEDKFNDLNKRYKRLNEILGRGTSCRVVENPTLMDSMPLLSAKSKDDVKKILSSKHLFYKEICAYHNGQRIPDCQDLDIQGCSLSIGGCSKENNGEEEEEEAHEQNDSDDDDAEELESEDDDKNNNNNNNGHRDEERMVEFGVRKKRKLREEDNGSFWSHPVEKDGFEVGMLSCLHDPTKSMWERREWIKKQMLHLQEQRVNFEAQAFELEKQRFKWFRYCCKKNRDFERLKLENERMTLENERRIILVRQKDVEIGFQKLELSVDPASLAIDRLQGRQHPQ